MLPVKQFPNVLCFSIVVVIIFVTNTIRSTHTHTNAIAKIDVTLAQRVSAAAAVAAAVAAALVDHKQNKTQIIHFSSLNKQLTQALSMAKRV